MNLKYPEPPVNEHLTAIKDYMKQHRTVEIVDDAINEVATQLPVNCIGHMIKSMSLYENSPCLEKIQLADHPVILHPADESKTTDLSYIELRARFRGESDTVVAKAQLFAKQDSSLKSLMNKLNVKLEAYNSNSANPDGVSSIYDFDKKILGEVSEGDSLDKFVMSLLYTSATCKLRNPFRDFDSLSNFVSVGNASLSVSAETAQQSLMLPILVSPHFDISLMVIDATDISASELFAKYETVFESYNQAVSNRLQALANQLASAVGGAAAQQADAKQKKDPKKKDNGLSNTSVPTNSVGALQLTDTPAHNIEVMAAVNDIAEIVGKGSISGIFQVAVCVKYDSPQREQISAEVNDFLAVKLVYTPADSLKLSEMDSVTTLFSKSRPNVVLLLNDTQKYDYSMIARLLVKTPYTMIQLPNPQLLTGGMVALETFLSSINSNQVH